MPAPDKRPPAPVPVTRHALGRALVVNALTKPLNVGAGAAIAVAGIVIGVSWVIALGLAVYVALAAASLFDGRETARLSKRIYGGDEPALPRADISKLAPEIAEPLAEARREEVAIRTAVEAAQLPFADVSAEIDGLMRDIERIAGRAQQLVDYLADQDEGELQAKLKRFERPTADAATADALKQAAEAVKEQIAANASLEQQRDRFLAELEHLVASLGVVRAQLVRMSIAEEGEVQQQVTGELRDMRSRMSALAQGMQEAFAGLPATTASTDPPASA
jgi:chromosome segregation ATPase